ncbi:hypothetical protein BCAMP_00500 [Brochothrix campestris FSL F6-1037]|uniref:Uncharacterized protein n=1 Tax=Brochothrix campestris FSL F6-1037 TaxID=1265861 RepID=W7DAD5_9LIST|nr:hypothetical protein BCAMP_00500 [Brochothrix campestris FSL F6-1037]
MILDRNVPNIYDRKFKKQSFEMINRETSNLGFPNQTLVIRKNSVRLMFNIQTMNPSFILSQTKRAVNEELKYFKE